MAKTEFLVRSVERSNSTSSNTSSNTSSITSSNTSAITSSATSSTTDIKSFLSKTEVDSAGKVSSDGDTSTLREAQQGIRYERDMSIREAVCLYPKAVFFSFGLSLAIVMAGYGLALMSNFFAVPQFRQAFGQRLADGDYQFSSTWQAMLASISNIGAIVGLAIVGELVERLGFRRSMAIALALMGAMIFVVFFADRVGVLLAGQLLCGIPWGMFQGMASTYAADVAPLPLRQLLTSYINLCWGMGQFLSVGVLKACLSRDDEWAYRIPFAVNWAWLPIISLVLYYAPESPWWLLKQGRIDEAQQALRQLASPAVPDSDIRATVQLMRLTNEREKSSGQASEGYADLFKGVNRRRTELTTFAWVCQVTCGTSLSGQATYFLQQVGISDENSFNFGLGVTALGCVGTIASWFIAPHVGRRRIYLCGLVGMFVTAITVGLLGIPTGAQNSLAWASAAMLILNNFVYSLSVGPIAFTIVTEMPSVRLRARTVAFARGAYLVAAFGADWLHPAMVNPTAFNLKGKAGLVWAAFCALSIVWVFFRLPESKDRHPVEMDVLFKNNVPARKFKHTVADEESGKGSKASSLMLG